MAGASSSRDSTPRIVRSVAAPAPSQPRLGNSGVLRVQQELRTLIHDPVPFIYVYADDSDVTKITALIIGPLETPYAGGFFRFSIRVVNDYPMKPPKVALETTDGGRVRFNPNLYNNGHVCLSILGTWAGPAWSSADSLSSVLLSIQSVMCPQPYHNEPGYESKDDPERKAAYNDYIRYETLRVAVLSTMEHSINSTFFPDVCERLFLLWYEMYVSMALDLQARVHGTTYKDVFSPQRGKYNIDVLLEQLRTTKQKVLDKLNAMNEAPAIEDIATPDTSKSTLSYAIDRLQDEFRQLLRQPRPGGSASPRNTEKPFIWDATVLGPENTPWEGGMFSLEIRFSYQHPHHPPFVRFLSSMHHPNITADGIPALDLIQTRWDPNTKVGTIVDELQNLLASPSSVYPVNMDVAHQYRVNRREYERRVRRIAQDDC